jgi:hypothetical protein
MKNDGRKKHITEVAMMRLIIPVNNISTSPLIDESRVALRRFDGKKM